MKRITLFVNLFLLIAHIAWGADWDFTDTLDDWEATGWQEWNYSGGGNPEAELIQNDDGTVTVVDPSGTANFYMMRKTNWEVPPVGHQENANGGRGSRSGCLER